MTERPILFSGEMVRAILENRKTQTRRVIKPQPAEHMVYCHDLRAVFEDEPFCFSGPNLAPDGKPIPYEKWPSGWPDVTSQMGCPYGKQGHHLWVRETFARCACEACLAVWPAKTPHGILGYRATYPGPSGMIFKPSIFMPRWASRITLEITDVTIERVQEISADDCAAEGSQYPVSTKDMPKGKCHPLLVISGKYAPCLYLDKADTDVHRAYSRAYFASLWDSINAKRGFGWDKNPWVWVIEFKKVSTR